MGEKIVHRVYLGLGTNLGDKIRNVEIALEKIADEIGRVVSVSSFYETKPQGFDSDNNFLNLVCLVETTIEPLAVLEKTQVIERDMGRRSKSINKQYADRIIDIDLLLFDDLILNLPHLTVPHPYIQDRLFVLEPLAEIAPGLFHPVCKITIEALKNNLLEK